MYIYFLKVYVCLFVKVYHWRFMSIHLFVKFCVWKSMFVTLCLYVYLWKYVCMYVCLCFWRPVYVYLLKQLCLFIFNLKFCVCLFEGLCLPMNLKIYVCMCLWIFFCLCICCTWTKFVSMNFIENLCLFVSLKICVYLKFYKVCYVWRTWKSRCKEPYLTKQLIILIHIRVHIIILFFS